MDTTWETTHQLHGAVIDQFYDGYQLALYNFKVWSIIRMYIHMLCTWEEDLVFICDTLCVLSSHSVSCLVNWNRNPANKNLEYIYNLVHNLICLMYGSEWCCGLAGSIAHFWGWPQNKMVASSNQCISIYIAIVSLSHIKNQSKLFTCTCIYT